MRFGILQRYVLGEVFRAFALALLTITCVFVLLTVMSTASQAGLGPREIINLVPFMIPRSLPYTVPVSLLFAATVVYGRLASDNEVIAVKTAGMSAMVLIWPSIALALVLSLSLSYLTATAIPLSANAAKQAIYQNIEDLFYKKLKMDRVFDVPDWPFLIKVKDVEGRILKGATFKQRADKQPQAQMALGLPGVIAPESGPDYQMIVMATEAMINFDFDHNRVVVHFKDADISRSGLEPSEGIVRDTSFPFDIPGKGQVWSNKMLEEMTVAELRAMELDYHEKIVAERKRQAIAAAWYIASGRLNRILWNELQAAFGKYDYWAGEITKIETEIQTRLSMAWGSLFFVLLGAPVGILFARRDFLSAFISCFMPIILVYYPLMLFGMNLGKEGIIPPMTVWVGNVVLGAAAWFWALPPVIKR